MRAVEFKRRLLGSVALSAVILEQLVELIGSVRKLLYGFAADSVHLEQILVFVEQVYHFLVLERSEKRAVTRVGFYEDALYRVH